MATRSRFSRNARTFSKDLTSAMAHGHHSRTRGDCPHCARTTRWIVRPLSGFYRCLDCGHDPLKTQDSVPA